MSHLRYCSVLVLISSTDLNMAELQRSQWLIWGSYLWKGVRVYCFILWYLRPQVLWRKCVLSNAHKLSWRHEKTLITSGWTCGGRQSSVEEVSSAPLAVSWKLLSVFFPSRLPGKNLCQGQGMHHSHGYTHSLFLSNTSNTPQFVSVMRKHSLFLAENI